MADFSTGMFAIAGTLFGYVAQWIIGRGTKESDELRTIYATWAAAAHHLVTTVEAVRGNAEVDAVVDGLSTDSMINLISENPKLWKATGIEEAFLALEKARFTVVMSDTNERRVGAVVEATKRLSDVRVSMSLEEIAAEKEALELVVTTHLRDSFRLRSIFDT